MELKNGRLRKGLKQERRLGWERNPAHVGDGTGKFEEVFYTWDGSRGEWSHVCPPVHRLSIDSL